MSQMRQILTILFKISRVNFFPDTRYINDHGGVYDVNHILMAVDNSFLGEIAFASRMTMSCFLSQSSGDGGEISHGRAPWSSRPLPKNEN